MMHFFRAMISLIRYAILRIAPLALFRNKKNNSGVYFSLTTTPSRIGKIGPTIKSLLHQSKKAQGIILNIPTKSRKDEEYHIPRFLSNHPSVIIQRCEDQGPGTKFLPTLKKFKNQTVDIIVVDDDQVYPFHLVEEYLRIKEANHNCAIALCGWLTPTELEHEKREIHRAAGIRLDKPFPNVKKTTEVDVIQGASSYMIQPAFFTDEIYKLIDSAFYADDIWISGHLAQQKIRKIVSPIKSPFCRLSSANRSQDKVSLKKTVNQDDKHNNNLYAFFKDYWRYTNTD